MIVWTDVRVGGMDGLTGWRQGGRTDGRTHGRAGERAYGRGCGRTDAQSGGRTDGRRGRVQKVSAVSKEGTAVPQREHPKEGMAVSYTRTDQECDVF